MFDKTGYKRYKILFRVYQTRSMTILAKSEDEAISRYHDTLRLDSVAESERESRYSYDITDVRCLDAQPNAVRTEPPNLWVSTPGYTARTTEHPFDFADVDIR